MTMHKMMATTTVNILDEVTTKGPAGALARTFNWVRSLPCRMIPMPAEMAVKLGINAQEFPHQLYTTTDPAMTERNRISWKNTTFRVRGIPQNAHGQNRFWILNLVCKSEDNGVPITGVPTELP
jgi:hypothetical protein